MGNQRGSRRRRPRRICAAWAIAWGVGTLAATFFVDLAPCRFPYLGDLVCAYAKQKGPVVLALGSSRTWGSFDVNRMTVGLNASLPDRRLAPFNAAVYASGISTQEEVFNNLLQVGPTPAVVIVEVNPEFLNRQNSWLNVWRDVTWQSMSTLERADLLRSGSRIAAIRLLPLYSRRADVRLAAWRWIHAKLGRPAPKLDSMELDVPQVRSEVAANVPAPSVLTDELRERQAQRASPPLVSFSATGSAAHALERILEGCQARGLPVLMIDAPVCTLSRRGEDGAKRRYADYIAGVLKRYPGARYWDASALLPDHAFVDQHHVDEYGRYLMCRHLAGVVLPDAFAAWEEGDNSLRVGAVSARSAVRPGDQTSR